MHVLSINFINFTAHFYNALHMQGKKGDFGILGGMAPLVSPKSAYDHNPSQTGQYSIYLRGGMEAELTLVLVIYQDGLAVRQLLIEVLTT